MQNSSRKSDPENRCDRAVRCLLLFSKPGRPGEVKTRLIGELSAQQAADLHEAFLLDLVDELSTGDFELWLCWAITADDDLPSFPVPGMRQLGTDLGARLHQALAEAARSHPYVAAVGSDHPELTVSIVESAFDKLATGVDVVVGPTGDGGYYLIALKAAAVDLRLFEGIEWSTPRVLEQTLEKCRKAGLQVVAAPRVEDVDSPADLGRLIGRLAVDPDRTGWRTYELLRSWGRL